MVAEPRVGVAVKKAAEWLEAEQDPDGGWGANCARTQPHCVPVDEVDITAAAIEALNAAGRHGTEAQARALAYLHEAQNSDGGFPEIPGSGESNSDSTAWAAQAIVAAGEAPATWVKDGRDPLQYLESMQLTDGGIRFTANTEANPTLNTAYALPALALRPLPIAPVALASLPPAPASAGSAPGVTSGGGGDGAPLFSAPQPQSQGHTPGAARALASRGARQSSKHAADVSAATLAAAVALHAAATPAQHQRRARVARTRDTRARRPLKAA